MSKFHRLARRRIAVAFIGSFAVVLTACSDKPAEPSAAKATAPATSPALANDGFTAITIATQSQPTGFPLWLAENLGYYKEGKLKVKYQAGASGAALLASGAAGDWQVGYLGGPPFMTGYQSWGLLPAGTMLGENKNLIMFMDKSVLKGKTPAQALKSTAVGLVPNSTSAQLLYACAAKWGVAPSAIQTVPLDPPAIVNGMLNGDVKAGVSFSTVDMPLVKDSARFAQVCNADMAGIDIEDPLVVTSKFWQENPKAAAEFVAAVYRANGWMKTAPRAEVLAKFKEFLASYGSVPDDATVEYAFDVRDWTSLDAALAEMKSGKFAKGLKDTGEFLNKAGVFKTMPDVDAATAAGLKIVEAAAAIKR